MAHYVLAALGRTLRDLREEQDMTRPAVASMAGVDRVTLSRFERGKLPYAPGRLGAILVGYAQATGRTVPELLHLWAAELERSGDAD